MREPAAAPAKRREAPEPAVIMFTSAKGGSGCSFLTCAIAEYMAQKTTLNTVLLDMNQGRMDSRLIFNTEGSDIRDLGDLPADIEKLDTSCLRKVVVNMDNSLNLMLPTTGIDRRPMEEADNFNIFLEVLRDHFDIILVDMPAYFFNGRDISGMEIADRFVFVSLPDIISANNIRILMDHIKSCRSDMDFYLVINKFNCRPAKSPASLSDIIRYPVTSFIPYDRDMEELVNIRGPEHIFDYNLRIARDISGLAREILEGLDL